MLACLEHIGEFSAEGCFTRTLQTRHQDNGGTVLEFQLRGLATHQVRQFIVDDLHHQLAGFHGSKHVHTHCLLLHSISKGLGNLIVNVGIQQGATHVFQGFGNVNLGDFAFTFQYLKRSF